MKGWKPVDSEQAYLSFDEQIVISARLHPVTAVLPVMKILVVGVALILASTSLWPVAIVFGLFAVQWIRKEGYVGKLGFVPVVILVGLLWYGTQRSLEVGARILLFLVVFMFVLIKGLVEYVFNRLYLTDKRIMLRSGILTERRSTLPLRALTDMRYDQTIPGRVFDYGHFFVESAGQNQALSTLRFVDNPVKFYRIAMQLALGGAIPPEELIQG